MQEDVLEKIHNLVPQDLWKDLKPLLEEAFKIDMAVYFTDFIMKHVDKRIYEPVFIEALKKEDEHVVQRPRGKEETAFETALVMFKELKTGDPNESFQIFLKMVQKIEIVDKIIPILKSDSDSKFEKVEALLMENEDLFK